MPSRFFLYQWCLIGLSAFGHNPFARHGRHRSALLIQFDSLGHDFFNEILGQAVVHVDNHFFQVLFLLPFQVGSSRFKFAESRVPGKVPGKAVQFLQRVGRSRFCLRKREWHCTAHPLAVSPRPESVQHVALGYAL